MERNGKYVIELNDTENGKQTEHTQEVQIEQHNETRDLTNEEVQNMPNKMKQEIINSSLNIHKNVIAPNTVILSTLMTNQEVYQIRDSQDDVLKQYIELLSTCSKQAKQKQTNLHTCLILKDCNSEKHKLIDCTVQY